MLHEQYTERSPRLIENTSKTSHKKGVLDILLNYFKNQTQVFLEIFSNCLKSNTQKDPGNSFKLLQKPNKRNPRDSFKLLQTAGTWASQDSSNYFFQIVPRAIYRGTPEIFPSYFKNQKNPQTISNYLKNQT